MKVDVVETTMVRPAQETPNEIIWLSNVDIFHVKNHVRTVHFYDPGDAHNSMTRTEMIRTLKDSLSKVLVPFYPVAGRLGKDEDGRLQIECNAKGALFLEAETDSTMKELRDDDFIPKSGFKNLILTVDYSAHISSYPLFIIQVTFFKCGGMCMGIGLQHNTADGIAALNLINSWAEIARGLPLSVTPMLDRTVFRNYKVNPTPKFKFPEYEPDPTIIAPEPNILFIANLKITVDQVKALKSKAGIRCSTYQAIVAHIWRCMSFAYRFPNDQKTKMYMAIDGRSRLIPQLPKSYFGNVVFPISPIALSKVIVEEPFCNTISRIQNAIRIVDDEYLRSALGCLENNPEILKVRQVASQAGCPTFAITDWVRLSWYESDFGWGSPIHVGPAGLKTDGKGYLMANPDGKGDGSLMLALCVRIECYEEFKNLFYQF